MNNHQAEWNTHLEQISTNTLTDGAKLRCLGSQPPSRTPKRLVSIHKCKEHSVGERVLNK